MRVWLLFILLSMHACKSGSKSQEPINNGNDNPPLTLPQQKPPLFPQSQPVLHTEADPSQSDPSQTDPNLEPVDPSQTAIDPVDNGNSPKAGTSTPPAQSPNKGDKSDKGGDNSNGNTGKTTASNPFYVQNAQGRNAARMTVRYEILADGSATVYLTFTALTALDDRKVGFPYHRLTIDFPQGDWKANKIVRNGHFRSNYYRIDSKSKKRDHFRIVLQALPRGANFQLEFAIPRSIVKELANGFELSLSMPYRQGLTFHFRDANGKSPAEIFKGL